MTPQEWRDVVSKDPVRMAKIKSISGKVDVRALCAQLAQMKIASAYDNLVLEGLV